jgi:magnesium transporter
MATETVAPADVLHFAEGFDGVLWIDVENPDDADIELLRNTFRFHQLALDDIQNSRIDIPKVDDYHDYLFIILQGIRWRQGNVGRYEFDLFLGKNYLVSVHPGPLEFVDQVFNICAADGRRVSRGADVLAHWLTDRLVDEMMSPLEKIDEQMSSLMDAIVHDRVESPLRSLLTARQEIARVRRAVTPQLELVNKIARQEFPDLISPNLTMYFRDIYDHLAHISDALDGLRDGADAALSMHLSVVNNRMNQVMKTFAVVAAIFLPMTLVASLYGMNVQLPGQDAEATFTVILVLMVAAGLGMAWFFRRKGWF